jgi:pyruvate dehydrogenase E2 component (dihydrolipoamide acetyltransferase)
MATDVIVPVPDQTTEEVRIVSWKKAAGETVDKGEILLEIETDKSIMEVEAVDSGVLIQRLVEEDDMVPVGQKIGVIGTAGEKVEEQAPAKPSEPAASAPALAKETKASPVAKRLAEKLGVDLSQITGSGPQGKITKEDVEAAAYKKESAPVPAAVTESGRIFASPNAKRVATELGVDYKQVTGTGPGGRIVGADVEKFATSSPATAVVDLTTPVAGQPQPGTEIEVTKMRRAIGANLQMSSRDTPHFDVTMNVEMTRAMEVRSRFNDGKAKEHRISVNDLIVRACGFALRQYPAVNSRLTEDKIIYMPDVNIGIAIALEGGLVVPVVTNVDQLNWGQIGEQTKEIARQARNGKMLNFGKGTFTISNLGMFGVDEFNAIINPPESAILAVGGMKNEVVDIGGGIGVRPMMKLTLCSDHRVIDGALAAQFLQSIKRYLEEQIS